MKLALRMLLVFDHTNVKNVGIFAVKVFGWVGQKFVTLYVKCKFEV